MKQLLLDNSISIIFLVTVSLLALSEYRRYLKEQGISSSDFRFIIREKFSRLVRTILLNVVASAAISFLISFFASQELWNDHTFMIVLLTSFLIKPAHEYFGLQPANKGF